MDHDENPPKMADLTLAAQGCPPLGDADKLKPGTAYVADHPETKMKSLWLFDGENHIVLASRDPDKLWVDRENVSTVMNGPARKRGEDIYDERTMD